MKKLIYIEENFISPDECQKFIDLSLLNKDNEEVARFIGDADWSSPHALKLIEKAIEVDLKD